MPLKRYDHVNEIISLCNDLTVWLFADDAGLEDSMGGCECPSLKPEGINLSIAILFDQLIVVTLSQGRCGVLVTHAMVLTL